MQRRRLVTTPYRATTGTVKKRKKNQTESSLKAESSLSFVLHAAKYVFQSQFGGGGDDDSLAI